MSLYPSVSKLHTPEMSQEVVLTARSANLSCKIKAGKLRHWPETSQTADPTSFVLKAALGMVAVKVIESIERVQLLCPNRKYTEP